MLGPPGDASDPGPVQPAHQAPAGNAAKHVVMAEPDALDAAADKGRADIADDGFDFGKLRHQNRLRWERRRGAQLQPGRLPPADIAAEDLPLETNRFRGFPAQPLGLGEGRGQGRGGHYSSSTYPEPPAVVPDGPGVEERHSLG